MHEICLTIKLDTDLDQQMPTAEPVPSSIHAHLITEDTKKIELKFYYDSKTYLDHKVTRLFERNKDPLSWAKVLKVVSINDEERLKEVDFANSKFKYYKTSTGFEENGNQYFLIGFDQIRLVFKPKEKDNEHDEWQTSEFYLNEASKNLIKEQYFFEGFMWKEPNVWRANNRQSEFLKFGEVEFLLDFHFYTKDGEKDAVAIIKEPRLNIRHQNLSEKEVRNYADLICSILSFYMNTPIFYNFSRIHTQEQTTTWTKVAKEEVVADWSRFIKFEFRLKFEDIIKQSDTKVLNSVEFFKKIVERYNLARNLEGEAEFMILYNLVEQVRTFFINEKEIQQAYKFTVSNDQANDFIKESLLKISEIVESEQQDDFKEHAINHVKTIKYLPMRKQVDALFTHLEITFGSLDVDFKKMLGLRNQIFHGGSIDAEDENLKNANKTLPKIVALLILNLLGIHQYNKTYQ